MHPAFLKSSFILARIFILVFLMLLPFAKGSAQTQPNAHELLGKMTLEEKIAQLSQLPGFPIPEFREQAGEPEDVIRKSGAGSVLWVSDPKEINRLQHIAVDESRLHIPILFGLDVIHGYHTIFPSPIAMASSWDPKLVESAQTVAAREARAAGIAWTFAPMLDIARDARWGRMVEGAGEDPYLGAAIARAQVLGFQGTKAGDPDRVLACAKHFAGYGAADGGRDYDSSYIPEEQMWNTYLPPFKAAADARVATFMSAYMDLNDVPATGNRWLLHDVLRDGWHYNGFVVSDANAVHSLITHGFARDGQDATLKAFSAGLDMDMASGTFLKYLGEEVKQGRISMQQVDDCRSAGSRSQDSPGIIRAPVCGRSPHSPGAQCVRAPRTRANGGAAIGRLTPQRTESASARQRTDPIYCGDRATRRCRSGSAGYVGRNNETCPTVTILQGIKNKVGNRVRVEFQHGPNIRRDIPSFFEDQPIITIKEQPQQNPEKARHALDGQLPRRSETTSRFWSSARLPS